MQIINNRETAQSEITGNQPYNYCNSHLRGITPMD